MHFTYRFSKCMICIYKPIKNKSAYVDGREQTTEMSSEDPSIHAVSIGRLANSPDSPPSE